MSDALLEIRDLHVAFGGGPVVVEAVRDVSLTVAPGRTLALVGESGSGKTVTSHSVLGLHPASARVSGSILFRGQELLGLDRRSVRSLRGDRIGMVFQDPLASLHPLIRVGDQIAETLRAHRRVTRRAARARALAMLDLVGLPDPEAVSRRRPFELSGGMRQRVMIAMALVCEPDLLIADEPTTALDVTVQAQILQLLDDLRAEMGMGLLLVTHDLGVVARVADDVAVMDAGRIVEHAPAQQLFDHPRAARTQALLAATPRPDRRMGA